MSRPRKLGPPAPAPIAEEGLRGRLWRAADDPESAEEIRPLAEGSHSPDMDEIAREMNVLYRQIALLVVEQAGSPEVREAVRQLRSRLRVLQQEEAEAMERHFRSQLLFDPRRGRSVLERAERLLGRQ